MVRLLLALAGLFAVIAPAAAQPLDIDDLAANPSLILPELSPNGRFIAAIEHTDDGDTIELIYTDDPLGERRRIELKPIHLIDLNWAGDTKLLLTTLTEDDVRGYKIKISRLVILDLMTNDVIIADKGARGIEAGKVLYIDPSAQWAIVQSQRRYWEPPSVKRVDLNTGEAETIERDRRDIWQWFVDGNGTVRAGIGGERKRWRIYYREQPGQELRLVKGRVHERDGFLVDSVHFGLPGAEAAILTNRGGDKFAAYEYDFQSGEIGDLIFSVPDADVESVISDRRDYSIMGFRYEGDRPGVHWIDPERAALQRRIDKALPNRTNRLISFSDDRQRVLIRSSGPTDSGTYFLLKRDTSEMGPLFHPYDRVESDLLSPTEPVRYTARDGLEIPAYITLPKDNSDATGLPLILMPHGGPFARDSWGYDKYVQMFASRGYAVLQPQFRGSTGRGRAFVEAGYGEWGGKMIDDMEDGVDWLARQGTVDADRVCIVGFSYGGYAAMWSAVRSPERYRCGASWAGVSNLKKASNFTRQYFNARRYFKDWRNAIAGEDKADIEAISPIHRADEVGIPLFIAHGEEDEVVEVDQSEKMIKEMEEAGIPVVSKIYEKAEHDFTLVNDEADYMKRLVAFVAEHNPAE